jgi:hypothetical protein
MRHIIFDNYYSSEAEKDAREYLFAEYGEDNEWNSPEDIPDDIVWKEIYNEQDICWDASRRDLERFFDGDNFLIYGTFGSWRGSLSAGKVISSFAELSDAWKDCDYLKLYDENGHFYIECSHHDGTNYYEVKRITAKGMELLDPWNLHDEQTHIKIFHCNIFSALPHYAHKVFGVKKYT